jgi:MOSC domain-containing protein YiiM
MPRVLMVGYGASRLTHHTGCAPFFGHADCGVYGDVVAAGEIAEGDAVTNH